MKYMHKHYVFRFYIPMEYFMSMHQLDCVKQIADDERGGFLRKSGAV